MIFSFDSRVEKYHQFLKHTLSNKGSFSMQINNEFSLNRYNLINRTLETLGYIDITDKTKGMIKEHLRKHKFTNKEDKILDVLKLIVSTPDFQYC